MIYDAIIVGAGPSGSYLAYLLAKDGFKVLIMDKASFPRDKVCGGGISQKTVDLLHFDITPVVQRRIQGAYLTYQNRDTLVKDLSDRSGCAVLRSEFDQFILEQAKSAGAEFRAPCVFENAEWTNDGMSVATSEGSFKGRFLFGADGVFSRVRNRLFDPGLVSYAPAVEALVYVPPAEIERFQNRVLFDFGGMPKGYGWIFPKRDHLNVGVFSIFGPRDINMDLQRFMARYRCLQTYTSIKRMGFAIPLKNRKKLYQQRNVWLLGDAAGFAESFYGEGIYFALKSAEIAAAALREGFNSPAEPVYTDYLNKGMTADLFYSELNARCFFPVQKFGFYQMVRNQYVNYYFAELIAGNVGHRECFYKTLLTSPYWLFSKNFPPLQDMEF